MHGSNQKNNGWARFFGSALTGLIEIGIFHPMDTIGKRMMVEDRSRLCENIKVTVFREAASGTASAKLASLYPGLSYGVLYKVSQRILRYGGQPYVYDFLHRHFNSNERNTIAIQAISGSAVGVAEVMLLPLDTFKIKRQTAPELLNGRSMFAIIRTENLRLYRGALWTAGRNMPGQFALFGANSGAKKLMGLDGKAGGQATMLQNFVTSSAGAVASLIVSQPMDVIKTRIQKRPFDSKETGSELVISLIRNEGWSGFLKGLPVKLMVVGPKIVFSFTVAQTLIGYLANRAVTLKSSGGRHSFISPPEEPYG
jgi:hypothetical protein